MIVNYSRPTCIMSLKAICKVFHMRSIWNFKVAYLMVKMLNLLTRLLGREQRETAYILASTSEHAFFFFLGLCKALQCTHFTCICEYKRMCASMEKYLGARVRASFNHKHSLFVTYCSCQLREKRWWNPNMLKPFFATGDVYSYFFERLQLLIIVTRINLIGWVLR